MRYTVLTTESYDYTRGLVELTNKVNEYIKLFSWKPQGGICVTINTTSSSTPTFYFSQAMVTDI